MNRNRRNPARATFGQAWQLRITGDFLDTFRRIIQAIRKAVRALEQPHTAPGLSTCTTTPPSTPEPPSSRTAPAGGFTEAPGWRAQPGFSVDTAPQIILPWSFLSLSTSRQILRRADEHR